jgi:hypothetical protein
VHQLVGSKRGHRRGSAVFVAKNKTTLIATTQDVVEVARHVSLSNKLGINQSNGSIFVGINATTVVSDHPRLRRKSNRRRYERNRGFHQNMESINFERGWSLRTSGREVDLYMYCTWPWPPYAHREIYTPNLVARSLQIDSRGRDRLSPWGFSFLRISSHG